MVDPTNMTNYDLNDQELEEYILFCIAVAGKTAWVTASILDKLLKYAHTKYRIKGWQPFKAIKKFDQPMLKQAMLDHGFGCHEMKSKGFLAVANSGLNLRTCTMFDLIKFHGVKYKTANFFLLHTRKNSRQAVIDTHILKHLASLGHKVPKSTPQSKKRYEELEKLFLDWADSQGRSLAELDLELWNKYARKKVQVNV